MAIGRKLPNSDESRNLALTAAKTKKDNTVPASIVITPNTVVRLDSTQPLLFSAMQTRANTLQAQSAATLLKNTTEKQAKMFISHFIQAFNNGVDRGIFPAAHRAFYQLDVSSSSVPDMDTEALLLLWGQRLITGDAARIAAGGTAMAMPSIAQVTVPYNSFKAANIAQSTAKDAYDNAQETVSDMRINVDNLILRIWDEVETAFNDEEIASKRRKAKEWGVVYTDSSAPPVTSGISITSDQSTISGMPLEIIITGNLSASGGTILTTWESGQTNSADLTAGGTIVFQHVYTSTGIKNITAAEVTAGVFGFISALQIPNMNATSITLGTDLSSATTFNFYGNKISLTNMYALITQINDYGTSGGLLNISGGTMPVPDPAFPALIALRSRGWIVTTN
ncbi:MAG: hypothetical protein HY840_15400 [Bacteroidetes bacterium]|nr:hypothetical protein [Bacteroidota bacterium]